MQPEELEHAELELEAAPPPPSNKRQTYLILLGCCILQLPTWGALSAQADVEPLLKEG